MLNMISYKKGSRKHQLLLNHCKLLIKQLGNTILFISLEIDKIHFTFSDFIFLIRHCIECHIILKITRHWI